MKNRVLISFLVIFLLSLGSIGVVYFKPFPQKTVTQKVYSVLDSLTKEERAVLSVFFREILIKESGAYTLFGDKPITMSHCFDLNHCSEDSLNFFIEQSALPFLFTMKAGWSLWEKMQSDLPIKNYCLRRVGNTSSEDINILLINKKSFAETAEEHINTFQSTLYSNISSQTLLKEFLTNSYPMRDVLKGHSGLVGILFGFGKKNSCLFHRLFEIDKRLSPNKFDQQLVGGLKSLSPSEGFQTLEEEKAALEKGTGHLDEFDNTILRLPVFKADLAEPETQLLKQKYTEQREKILPLLEKDDFLEQVLLQLCS